MGTRHSSCLSLSSKTQFHASPWSYLHLISILSCQCPNSMLFPLHHPSSVESSLELLTTQVLPGSVLISEQPYSAPGLIFAVVIASFSFLLIRLSLLSCLKVPSNIILSEELVPLLDLQVTIAERK